MSTDTEERLNKILKYGGAGLLALLVLGVFAWRLDFAQRRAASAESELASLRQEMGKVKAVTNRATQKTPTPQVPTMTPSAKSSQPFFGSDEKTRSILIGRWVNHGVYDGKDCTRTLIFGQHGTGEFLMKYSGGRDGIISTESGPWNVHGGICYIDVKSKDVDTYYFRIIRLTRERLSIRNDRGDERVYERIE